MYVVHSQLKLPFKSRHNLLADSVSFVTGTVHANVLCRLIIHGKPYCVHLSLIVFIIKYFESRPSFDHVFITSFYFQIMICL